MKFNKKIFYRILKIILVIIIFVVISFTNGKNRKVTFIEELFGEIVMLPQKGITYLKNIMNEDNTNNDSEKIVAENKELKNENNLLKEKLATFDLIMQENRELKNKQNMTNQYVDQKVVIANVIAKTSNNWDEIYVIDKGTDDGINPKSVAVTVDGLVGYVLTCDNKTSKVISILDATSTFSARARETREEVIIKGDISYKNKNMVRVTDIPLGVTYKSGDVFETSGIGGVYQKGITIGKVVEFVPKLNPIENEAIVELAVDFERIENVAVIIE